MLSPQDRQGHLEGDDGLSGQGRLWRRYECNRVGELARKHDARRGATGHCHELPGSFFPEPL